MREYKELCIARDYSSTPGTRLIIEGPFSGELFRNSLLEPNMKDSIENDKILRVVLDGVEGYTTSFLEESFGGLIRRGLKLVDIIKHLELISNEEPDLIDTIERYMKEAAENIINER